MIHRMVRLSRPGVVYGAPALINAQLVFVVSTNALTRYVILVPGGLHLMLNEDWL
jgi:hypothetical protein